MADWSKIQNAVDLVLNSVGSTRAVQGQWYWREAVRRAVQDFRETGTTAVFPLTVMSAAAVTAISAAANRLFGVLIDNSASGTDFYTQLWNVASGGVTIGTTVEILDLWTPRATVTLYAFTAPIVNSTALTVGVSTAPHGATQTGAAQVSVAAVYST